MRRSFIHTFGAVALICGALAAPAFAQDMQRSITVSGTGEVSVAPDMAHVQIGVQADAVVAAEALDQASAATAAVLAQLDTQGIDPLDIQTGSLQLIPRYASSVLGTQQNITGYQAVNSIEVAVRDLDDLGGLLAAVVGEGANRLDGVSFGLTNPDAALDEARKNAVAEAIRLAGLYAEAAGVVVGEVKMISEAGSSGYRMMRAEPMMMDMAASSPAFDVPVSAGLIELRADVTMVFAIAE